MFNVEIEEKELTLMLVKSIDHEHADKIAQIIICHMSKDKIGLSQLFKSFMGIIPETNFKIGDVIRVHLDHLPRWRMDLDVMATKSMLHKNHLACVVTNIDLSKDTCLSIKFKYLTKDDKEVIDTYEVSQSAAVIEDEIFFKLEETDQLPF
jgi:hypothetical protein